MRKTLGRDGLRLGGVLSGTLYRNGWLILDGLWKLGDQLGA